MKENIFTIDHFYDLVDEKLGSEYRELLEGFVHDEVNKATEQIKNNFDILYAGFAEFRRETNFLEDEMGLEKAVHFREEYDIDVSEQATACRLVEKVYEKFHNPKYDVNMEVEKDV